MANYRALSFSIITPILKYPPDLSLPSLQWCDIWKMLGFLQHVVKSLKRIYYV